VEIVCRHGHLGYLEVNVLPCKIIISPFSCVISLRVNILKESLDVAGGMLWAGSIKAMRKKKDHSTLPKPF
jgi:hypothetical protein